MIFLVALTFFFILATAVSLKLEIDGAYEFNISGYFLALAFAIALAYMNIKHEMLMDISCSVASEKLIELCQSR